MKIIITCGGTKEPIDPVRNITNMSKGTLGYSVATYAAFKEEITKIYVLSPVEPHESLIEMVNEKIEWRQTKSVENVAEILKNLLTTEKIDAVVHSMAVSDYTTDKVFAIEDMFAELANYVNNTSDTGEMTGEQLMMWFENGGFFLDNTTKVSSASDNLCIKLKPTTKIISLIKQWSPETLLVGFKLLENVSDEHLLEVAKKLKDKNQCSYVFCNDIKRIRDNKRHEGFLVLPDNTELPLVGLDTISAGIIDRIVGDLRGK
jgi:phosphopantothenate--cysteine ligase